MVTKTASLLYFEAVKEYMDDSTFRLETKKVDLNIENSLVIEESDIESANYLFRPAATSANEYSNVVSPISDHSNSSSPTNEHQQVEQEIRHIRKHQELLLVHPFHLIDQFAHLRGVLSTRSSS